LPLYGQAIGISVLAEGSLGCLKLVAGLIQSGSSLCCFCRKPQKSSRQFKYTKEYNMLGDAFGRQADQLAGLAPILAAAMDRLENAGNLTFAQGLLLAAATFELRPQVVLDIGTGGGGSAKAFGLAGATYGARVYTFDLYPAWNEAIKPKLSREVVRRISDVVIPVVGDITTQNLSTFTASANPIIVFWDAHGYKIAECILSRLLPLIAEKKHLIICHDMSDNRLRPNKPYDNKPFWRGLDGAHEGKFAYVNLGHTTAIVEQVIPILDFCWRNGISLHSIDSELHLEPGNEKRRELLYQFGLPNSTLLDIAYFTLNETTARHFPPAGEGEIGPSRHFG
jgi:predicted O-methyltransferase YrrM